MRTPGLGFLLALRQQPVADAGIRSFGKTCSYVLASIPSGFKTASFMNWGNRWPVSVRRRTQAKQGGLRTFEGRMFRRTNRGLPCRRPRGDAHRCTSWRRLILGRAVAVEGVVKLHNPKGIVMISDRREKPVINQTKRIAAKKGLQILCLFLCLVLHRIAWNCPIFHICPQILDYRIHSA
jgi:hypothetical protein